MLKEYGQPHFAVIDGGLPKKTWKQELGTKPVSRVRNLQQFCRPKVPKLYQAPLR
jgi:hypothetical protein